MTIEKPLQGSVAIVTGSSRGIGRAVAEALAARGAAVVVNGRAAQPAEEVERAIASAGGRAVAVTGSAARRAVVKDLVAAAVDGFGRLDILINCAGTAEPAGSSILDISDAAWDELIDTHLTSTFRTCRAAAPLFAQQRRGVIVNTSSHAFLGIFGGTGYPAGKGGVNSLTMAIAAELKEYGVRANAVCPGARTRLSTGEEYQRHIESLFARGLLDQATRWGSLHPAPPAYVAPLYAYLASDLSAGITGQIFASAGGYLARFEPPAPRPLAWRDHQANPPWTLEEIDASVRAD
jgi:NAD(P)-dependent dehydrogenase (short-subunit alcohol dehydrogenase family)